ncbi:retrovirus-related Pol polyprotein from transposon 297 [Trichonephila clavipes]|uniref:Retrovirus-related Pol polyprotein from transposon 297 n=1 Tax=Trichonephila clavipes TaxID=2585209 RepID=A0A8X7BJ69_TRICX|nr:retrovirus-related Pol polyprotein from transposon 297 [Trichonephila clavipes]
MQNARDLFEIGQARFISVLDLTKGYWQIPMKDEAKPLTAFVTHSGHYQLKVMPFDMKNAGSTFQKSMDNALLLHRKYCRSYIDDVAIYSNEHLDHIAKVFKSLKEVGLKVNLEKCAFGRKSVKFLGHIVGSGKHSPDPEKVETIRKLSRPTTKSENDIPWESSAEESFVRLKEELVKMPSLHTLDLSRPFLLFTDASATAIGACLAQHNDPREEMPIAFFS